MPNPGRILVLLVLACLAGGGLARAQEAGKPLPPARVSAVIVGGAAEDTRVEIVSDRPLNARVFTLADQKPRVVVDFPTVVWSFNGIVSERGEQVGLGAVAKYRYAQNSPTRSRLVFDLAGPIALEVQHAVTIGGPARLILRLKPSDPAAFAKAAGFPAVATSVEAPPAPEAPKVRKRVIIIDAGHGGKDPGALAVTGLQEKFATLAAAKQLAEMLEATGRYKVVLTRADDTYLPLETRVEIAREAKADLFLSLHADSGGDPDIKGASVYTLSEAGTERAKSIMAAQDWSIDADTSGKPKVVADILVDLAQRDTKNQSAVFAQRLIPKLRDAGASVLQNSHRNAGFFVLLAPDVPAVLLEMGFLSNKEDATALGSAKERARLMNGVAGAIDDYFTPPAELKEARK